MFCRGRVYVFYLYAEDDWPTLEPCRAVLSRQAYYMDRGEGVGGGLFVSIIYQAIWYSLVCLKDC